MRASLLSLFAFLVLTGCCRTHYEIYPESRETPEDAYRLIRAALLGEEPVLLYESLTPEFRRRLGVSDLREFVAAYELRKDDFDRLASVVEDAEVGEVTYGEHAGLRLARLPVTAYGRTVNFFLIQVPITRLEADLGPPYGRTAFVDEIEWTKMLAVDDEGQVGLRHPYDASAAGITTPEEIHELRFHREWFLFDIPDLPEELKALMGPQEAQP
ncbi:MAG: hypothetical protein ABFS86_09085 [Planctomycetota bacterium]